MVKQIQMIEKYYVYLMSNGVQHKFILQVTFEQLEDWITHNDVLLHESNIKCDITDSLDRLVACNYYDDNFLAVNWSVTH